MNILYLITGLGGGGAEKVVADLADQMYLRGHHVKIAYLKGEAIVRPESNNIELVCLELNKITQFRSAFKNFKTVIEQFKPDIVHAHMVHANIFARLARKYVSFPRLICSAHSNNEGGRFRMLAYKYTHKLADVTTNVSKNASHSFEKLGAVPIGEITTVYNGIDLKKFEKFNSNILLKEELSIDVQTPIFLAVGRFHDAKDYPNLIRSFLYLKSNNIFKEKKPKLLIAGDGEGRLKIEQLIQYLELETDIILLGRRDDIAALLNMADFFVLSSKYEGLPTVIIEAMACETYVIATDCGGSAEIMGDTGTLVPIQDSHTLSDAMVHVLTLDNASIVSNNKKARQRVENLFSLTSSVNHWIEIYES
ncbi:MULTISPECIES: glycosyltransferase [Acinetobacter calcoaceticus/baumannii complex]|uniref:glycosyltransferase n=1 Tax=Acinetobacter calcoaceticus/baumannii complex TaxID=909768 RepID=UPI000DAA4934|nr:MULTISPECIES: glycosyltransferase [Acinetobacter calcoaceticus/baumannii complex]MBP1491303.1 glycosyltransferase [Acinetobacter nosocomialis]MCZ3261735.1 glycosyltransferase [Acinetobacter baumannii]PZM01598.1 glycosyl transferase [Acinetobacter nosocomialis]QRF09901.1 glycosyltransferase [Acinetobacter pittii]